MDVVFYHRHQNGDTFTSRLFVKHFIEKTSGMGYNYFYSSDNSLESHCEDIGISNENFNVIKPPTIQEGMYYTKKIINCLSICGLVVANIMHVFGV